MTKVEALQFFGTVTELARALGIDQSSYYSWGEFPPDRRQLQLERITGGRLSAEPGCRERVLGLPEKKGRK